MAIARLEGDRNIMSELDGYKFSGVYSNTFADDTFGVLLGVVFAEREDRTDIAGNDGGWTRNPDPNDESWLWGNAWGGNIDPNGNGELDEDEYGLIGPGQFRVGSILEEKKRRAVTAKLEWRPSDNVRIVADGLKTRLDSPQVGYQQSYYPLFAPERWTDFNIEDGIVTGFTMDNADPEMALNPELLNVTEHRVVDTDLYGINGEWMVSDALTLTGDLYRSTSRRALGRAGHLRRAAHEPSRIPGRSARRRRGAERHRGLRRWPRAAEGPGERRVRRLGFQHALHGAARRQHRGRNHRRPRWPANCIDKSGMQTLHFGVVATKREKVRDLVNNTLNGGADYYSGDNAINVGDLDGDVISHSFQLPQFHERRQRGLSAHLPGLRRAHLPGRPRGLRWQCAARRRHLRLLERRARVESTPELSRQRKDHGLLRAGRLRRRTLERGRGRALREDQAPPRRPGMRRFSASPRTAPFNYTAEYADPTPVEQDGDYSFVLPSANFAWRFTDELQLRLGAAKTMARPPVDKLAPTNTTESISWGEFTQIFGGNVDLKPYSAQAGGRLAGVVLRGELDLQPGRFLQADREPDHQQLGAGPGHRRAGLPVQRQPSDQW